MNFVSETIVVISEMSDLDRSALSAETDLDTLGIHSLELTEIIMELEERYNVEIDLNTTNAWSTLRTIGDVADRVSTLVAAKAAAE